MPPAPPILNQINCPHQKISGQSGLVIITIGNPLRGDDGLSRALCDSLPPALSKAVCRFDLGNYTNFIGDCLHGHSAAIIIDATQTGSAPGTVSLINLKEYADARHTLEVKASHGLSLADELRIAASSQTLPAKILFFGVEIESWGWSQSLSKTMEAMLSEITEKLASEIELCLKEIETLEGTQSHA